MQLAGYRSVRLCIASRHLPAMNELVVKGTVDPCFEQDLSVIHPQALAEVSLAALAASATSAGSGCAVSQLS